MDEDVGAGTGGHGPVEARVSLLGSARCTFLPNATRRDAPDFTPILLNYILQLLICDILAAIPIDISDHSSEDFRLLRRSLQGEFGVAM